MTDFPQIPSESLDRSITSKEPTFAVKLSPGMVAEAKVLEADQLGRIRIEILGREYLGMLKQIGAEAGLQKLGESMVGKNVVLRVASTHPELLLDKTAVLDDHTSARAGRATSFEGARSGDIVEGRIKTLEPPLRPTAEGPYRAVIETRGGNVPVMLTHPAEVGRPVMFRILDSGPPPVLYPLPPDATGKNEGPQISFTKDGLVFGKILKLRPPPPGTEGIALRRTPAYVEVAGKGVQVFLEGKFVEGESRMLRVLDPAFPPLLTTAEGMETGEPDDSTILRHLFSSRLLGARSFDTLIRTAAEFASKAQDAPELSETLRRGADLIRNLVYDETQLGRSDFFRRFLQLSGFLTESGSAEGAKPEAGIETDPQNARELLSRIEQQVSRYLEHGRNSPEHNELRSLAGQLQDSAKGLLQHLLAAQTLNTMSFAENGTMSFDIPFGWAGLIEPGRLSVQFREDGGEDDSEDRGPTEILIVFLLDLQRIGPIRVDALIKKEDHVSVTVMVEDSEVADYVKNRLPELESALEASGFSVERLSCLKTLPNRIKEESRPEGLEEMDANRMHIIA